ncbi:MAG: enoyl-CoA hydratase-related protein [Smithella sp.]
MADTLFEEKDGIAIITLNRPEKLNSLSMAQLEELTLKINAFEQDDSVRVIIITGTGKGFSTGADLSGSGGRTDAGTGLGMKLSTHIYGRVCFALANCEKPVIGAVNGVAAGAGCNLALSCDIILAAKSARFIQIFARRGLVPDLGGSYFLPRLVGLAKAKELMFTGDPISAEKALELGMINRVVDDADLMAEAMALAGKLAQGATRSIGMIKHLLNRSLNTDLVTQLEFEAAYQGLAATTDDFKEGVVSFLEKRDPCFRGK